MSNIQIKTDNTHKSAKIITSAKKKLVTTLAIGNAILVIFSGCKSLANEKSQTTKIPLTTYTDNLENNDNTTKSSTNYTTQKNYSTTNNSFNTIVNNQNTTSSRLETTQTQNNDSYNQLLQELNQVISSKNFTSEAKKIIIETFDGIYKNYDTWGNLYKDLPSKEEYIKDKLINSLNYVNEINVYKEDSKEAEKILEENGYNTFTTYDNKIIITVSEDETNLEKFMHEMTHIEQNKEENASKDKQNYFYKGQDLSSLFREGEATFNQVFTSKMSNTKEQFVSRENQKGEIIYYAKAVECGYSDYLYVYNNLVNLVGYENISKVKGKNIFGQIEYLLGEKYGREGAKEILDGIAKWEKTRPTGFDTKSNEAYDSAIELQNIFDKYIIKDISNLKTENEIREYKKMYEQYKLIVLPQVIDTNLDYKDITEDVFKTQKVDKELENKAQKIQELEER